MNKKQQGYVESLENEKNKKEIEIAILEKEVEILELKIEEVITLK